MDRSDDTAGVRWTNAAHSSYLNSVEAMFTHKLYERGFSQFPLYGVDSQSDRTARVGPDESLATRSGLTSDAIVNLAPLKPGSSIYLFPETVTDNSERMEDEGKRNVAQAETGSCKDKSTCAEGGNEEGSFVLGHTRSKKGIGEKKRTVWEQDSRGM